MSVYIVSFASILLAGGPQVIALLLLFILLLLAERRRLIKEVTRLDNRTLDVLDNHHSDSLRGVQAIQALQILLSEIRLR